MPEVMFNGPEGRIEGRYHHSEKNNPPIALVLHPHPSHGGTMNNKVVYNTYHSLVRSGFSVLRINFRGVGRSQGAFDDGIGELADAATALDWLEQHNPTACTVWIAGFSFGAWIALQLLMRRPEIQNFIAISPPAAKYNFSFLSPCPSPGLIIQGDADSIVLEEDVENFVNKLSKQKGSSVDYRVIATADHFFREKMDELIQNLDEYISEKLTNVKSVKTKNDRRRRQVQPIAELS
jgi:alpha/beta superfamily hydrolase